MLIHDYYVFSFYPLAIVHTHACKVNIHFGKVLIICAVENQTKNCLEKSWYYFISFCVLILCIHVILMFLSKAHQFAKEQYKYYSSKSSIFERAGGEISDCDKVWRSAINWRDISWMQTAVYLLVVCNFRFKWITLSCKTLVTNMEFTPDKRQTIKHSTKPMTQGYIAVECLVEHRAIHVLIVTTVNELATLFEINAKMNSETWMKRETNSQYMPHNEPLPIIPANWICLTIFFPRDILSLLTINMWRGSARKAVPINWVLFANQL